MINDDPKERRNVYEFFLRWANLALQILVPGGHVFIASTPLLSDILSTAMRDGGFERRGGIAKIVRLVYELIHAKGEYIGIGNTSESFSRFFFS